MANNRGWRGRGVGLWEREELEIALDKSEMDTRKEQALTVIKALDSAGWETWMAGHCPPWMDGMTAQVVEIVEARALELLREAMHGLSLVDVVTFCELVEQGNDHALVVSQVGGAGPVAKAGMFGRVEGRPAEGCAGDDG